MKQLLDNDKILQEYLLTLRRNNFSPAYLRLNKIIISKIPNLNSATSEDIINVLDRLKKPEREDPLHKWIGTYNMHVIIYKKFFKWFNAPYCMEGVNRLKRKEKSIYKPTDMWNQEDDILFLRYCHSKRDRCYHAMARDSSCRPSELLNLRLKDLVFKQIGNKQYAEILVNGKTGSRHIPLINSIPYIKDWLSDHPEKANTKAYLFKSERGRNAIIPFTLYKNYRYYKNMFSKIDIRSEDREGMEKLLSKPFNPYIFRHSSLTEKSKILKEHILRNHAGWSMNSKMPSTYLHYFGNESSEAILEAYGLKPSTKEEDRLRPKECPNCREPNNIDSKFCSNCRFILSYDAYQEVIAQKEEPLNIKLLEEIRRKVDALERRS